MGHDRKPSPPNRPREAATLLLGGLAIWTCGLVLGDATGQPGQAMLWSGILSAATLAGFLLLAARAAGGIPRPWADLLSLGAFLLPFAMDWLHLGQMGPLTLELRFLVGLRNVVLLASAQCRQPRMMRMAASGSLFTVLIAFALRSGLAMLLLSLLYTAAGVSWLMLSYWTPLAGRPAVGRRKGFPLAPAVLLALLAAAVGFAGVLLYPETLKQPLEQLSGGATVSEHLDRPQRSELGNRNGLAFGDLANQKYGTAASGRGGAGGAGAKAEGASAGTQGAGGQDAGDGTNDARTQFALARQSGTEPDGTPRDPHRVLFQAQGSGPSHVPVATYDQLDAGNWQAAPSQNHPQASVDLMAEGAFESVFEPLEFSLDPGSGPEGGEIDDESLPPNESRDAVQQGRASLRQLAMRLQGGGRIVKPQRHRRSNKYMERLLAEGPPGLNDIRDFEQMLTPYDWERMRTMVSPEKMLLLKTREDNQRGDFRNEFLTRFLRWRLAHRAEGVPREIVELARRWTAGKEPGWDQIDAVVQSLRKHAVYDPNALPPPLTPDPVLYFLVTSLRGPDYLFASSAVVILRHLGYPSRMVGGFYVRPDAYHRLTDTTAVRASDVHYWAQAQLLDGTWVNLEPTPGFDPPRMIRPLWPQILAAWGDFVMARKQHGSAALAVLVLLIGLYLIRGRLAERAATAAWLARRRRRADRLVTATWRLLERRSSLAGRPRPSGRTFAGWYPALVARRPAARERLDALAAIADWTAHAPGGLTSAVRWPEPEVRRICRESVKLCTVAALRGLRVQEGNP